jgi:hypothetical protein
MTKKEFLKFAAELYKDHSMSDLIEPDFITVFIGNKTKQGGNYCTFNTLGTFNHEAEKFTVDLIKHHYRSIKKDSTQGKRKPFER